MQHIHIPISYSWWMETVSWQAVQGFVVRQIVWMDEHLMSEACYVYTVDSIFVITHILEGIRHERDDTIQTQCSTCYMVQVPGFQWFVLSDRRHNLTSAPICSVLSFAEAGVTNWDRVKGL